MIMNSLYKKMFLKNIEQLHKHVIYHGLNQFKDFYHQQLLYKVNGDCIHKRKDINIWYRNKLE